jgi:hypothetical protein
MNSVISYISLTLAVEENARRFWKRFHDKLWLGLGTEVHVVKKRKMLPPRMEPHLLARYRIIGRIFQFDTAHTRDST